jgi:ABC-type transport system substrate-binding protein
MCSRKAPRNIIRSLQGKIDLTAMDVPRINAICEVGAQMLRSIGLNVDEVSTDWGTVVQRSVRSQPLDKGGWSMFDAFWGGYDMMSPAGHHRVTAPAARARPWFCAVADPALRPVAACRDVSVEAAIASTFAAGTARR